MKEQTFIIRTKQSLVLEEDLIFKKLFNRYSLDDEDNARPEKPFGYHKVCSKCGGKKFERTFSPHISYPETGYNIHEHINAECKKCGATFWEKPKDAK